VTELGVSGLMLTASVTLASPSRRNPSTQASGPPSDPRPDAPSRSAPRPGCGSTWSSTPAATSDPLDLGVHQRLQARHELRVGLGQLLTPASGRPHPNLRLGVTLQLPDRRATVSACTPVASATVLIPPCPSAAASEPNSHRRSSSCGRKVPTLRGLRRPHVVGVTQHWGPQHYKPKPLRRES
jgi:hypothetical protein